MDNWLVILMLGQLAFLSVLIWTGTYYRIQKNRQRTEERLRILERFTSADELSAFLASPGGKDFLDVFGHRPEGTDPRRTVLNTLAAGIVLFFLGGGFLMLTSIRRLSEPEIFYIPGLLSVFGGFGILLAAIISWFGIRKGQLDGVRRDPEL